MYRQGNQSKFATENRTTCIPCIRQFLEAPCSAILGIGEPRVEAIAIMQKSSFVQAENCSTLLQLLWFSCGGYLRAFSNFVSSIKQAFQ